MAESGLQHAIRDACFRYHSVLLSLVCKICSHCFKLVPVPLNVTSMFQAGRETKGWRTKAEKEHVHWVCPFNKLSQKCHPLHILYYIYYIIPLMFYYPEHCLSVTLAARDSRKLNTFNISHSFPEQIWGSISKEKKENICLRFIEKLLCAREYAKSWRCRWPQAPGLVWKRGEYNRAMHSSLVSCVKEHLEWALFCQVWNGCEISFPSIPFLHPFQSPASLGYCSVDGGPPCMSWLGIEDTEHRKRLPFLWMIDL